MLLAESSGFLIKSLMSHLFIFMFVRREILGVVLKIKSAYNILMDGGTIVIFMRLTNIFHIWKIPPAMNILPPSFISLSFLTYNTIHIYYFDHHLYFICKENIIMCDIDWFVSLCSFEILNFYNFSKYIIRNIIIQSFTSINVKNQKG